jgi:hypothetical protein
MDPIDRAIPSPAEPFVRELVPLAGQLHLVLSHMEQFVADGDATAPMPPIPDALAGLLDGILTPLARSRPEELEVAADVLHAVSDAVAAEILLVEPEPRRRRPPRRPSCTP